MVRQAFYEKLRFVKEIKSGKNCFHIYINSLHSFFSVFGMLPYYIYMALYLVPIMVIHSFMGQFSSSGFISSFRVSPFFKGNISIYRTWIFILIFCYLGMGYMSLILSLASLLYYGIFAIVPLIFIVHSLRPALPWSCENFVPDKNVTTVSMRMYNSLIKLVFKF